MIFVIDETSDPPVPAVVLGCGPTDVVVVRLGWGWGTIGDVVDDDVVVEVEVPVVTVVVVAGIITVVVEKAC